MTISRILVCGGRDYSDHEAFARAMEHAKQWFAERYCIIQGGARGADRLAKIWGNMRGVAGIQVDANWPFYDKAAGTIRNGWMAEFCLPQLTIAFPGGTGTARMIAISNENNIPVWEPYK